MGKKIFGTNEFAFFRCKSRCAGGGPESGFEKNSKNAFRPKLVQKYIFPVFVTLFLSLSPFSGGPEDALGKARKRRKKAFFLRYPRISLHTLPFLNPHYAAPQINSETFCSYQLRSADVPL